MATTYTNMGLKSWNAGADLFSYADLDANWAKIANHDHTSGNGVQVPTDGIADNAITSAKILNGTITGSDIASATVTSSNIVDATVADSDLASPNNGIWKTVLERSGVVTTGASTPVFLGPRSASGADEDDVPFFSGRVFYLDPADYAVAGKTTKYRLRGTLITNTAPGTSFTFRLVSIGATSAFAATVSTTHITSSTITTPGANTLNNTTSSELTAPVADYYALALGCTSLATTVVANCQLQIRHV